MKVYGSRPWSCVTIGFVVALLHLSATICLFATSVPLYGDRASTIQLMGQVLMWAFLAPLGWVDPYLLFWLNSALIGFVAALVVRSKRRKLAFGRTRVDLPSRTAENPR